MRTLCGGVVALALSGCWLQPGYGPEGQRYNPLERTITSANVDELTEAWQVDTGLGGQPLVRGGHVLLGATRSVDETGVTSAAALSLATGETVWSRELASGWLPPTTAVGPTMVGDEMRLGHTVTAGADFATEYLRLDPDDGSPVGAVTEDWFATVPTATSTIVADVSQLGFEPEAQWRLTVRDAATTDVLWTASLPAGAAEPLTPGAPGPLVAHGQVYVATDEGLLAFDADGCGAPTCGPTWTVPIQPEGSRLSLAAATDDGHVAVTFRRTETDGGTGATYTRTRLIAVTSAGAHAWTVPPPEGASNEIVGTAVAGDVVYVAGREGGDGPEPARHHLRAYSSSTGALLWSADGAPLAPTSGAGDVVVGGDVVYVGVEGAVLAFARAGCGSPSCPLLAELAVPGTAGPMAIAGGHLLVTSGATPTTTTLTAFAPG